MEFPHLKAIALALALGAASAPLAAQDFAIRWNPRSGDVWVDQRLGDLNDYGRRHRGPFVDEVVRHYGAPRDLVSDLLVRRNWAPGDVYYACAIANILGVPCRNVVNEWDRSHGQGWGAVARRMGIKPGSAQFHQLKRGFVPSYDRWGRTVVLDRDLERAYPNRGKGARQGHAAPRAKASPAASRGNGQGKAKPAHTAPRGNSGKARTDNGNHGKGKGNGRG